MWTLPGGGIELLEPSDKALKREMQEELQVDIRIERLLWVIEQELGDAFTADIQTAWLEFYRFLAYLSSESP